MTYGNFTYLFRRPAFDKVLHDKALNIARKSRYYGYKRRLASVVYKAFDKNSSGGAVTPTEKSAIENKIMSNQELYSSFRDKTWATNLADMINDFFFHHVLLIFIANMPGLFL